MDADLEVRFTAFLKAVQTNLGDNPADGIALHHSAVEVNGWTEIQNALGATIKAPCDNEHFVPPPGQADK